MKTTRKLLAAVMALAMVSALAPMGAFAADGDPTTVDQNSTDKTGKMTATYDIQAKYTVTIPSGVTLDSQAPVSKSISASNVMLESGQKIKVKLTEASNTPNGSSFSAKTSGGESTAAYTISKGGTAVAVGDTVAEFTEDGTATLTFSEPTGATYAGTHTETLTFGIAVENAVVTPKTYPSLKTGDILHVGDIVTSADSTSGYDFRDYSGSFPKMWSIKLVRADISISGGSYASVTESDTGAYYIFLDLSEDEGSRYRNLWLSDVTTQEQLDNRTGKVIFKATETSDGLEVTVENGNKISFSVHES